MLMGRMNRELASVQSEMVIYGEVGKDFCSGLFKPFPENINGGSRNDGTRELTPIFELLHRKGRFSAQATVFTFQYL